MHAELIRLQFLVWFDNDQFLMGFSLTLNYEEVLLTHLFCRHFGHKFHVKNSVSLNMRHNFNQLIQVVNELIQIAQPTSFLASWG